MFLSEWREFPSAPCIAGGKKNSMTTRVSMSLKSRASLTCFRACVLPGRAKDLSAPWYVCRDEEVTDVCDAVRHTHIRVHQRDLETLRGVELYLQS